jgi:hypothetical protein
MEETNVQILAYRGHGSNAMKTASAVSFLEDWHGYTNA